MASASHLIIGLGNPGDDYEKTRHNIGFMAVDAIARHKLCPAWKKKFRSLVTGLDDFLLCKPQTFMNLSGEAALEAFQFYELHSENVVVLHDDLDLLPGQVKIKKGGGSGGHNGLKSLDTHIGQDYWRIRLGIGRPLTEQGEPVKGEAVTNYVLNPFSKSDKMWLEPLVTTLAQEFSLILEHKFAELSAKLSSSL